MRGWFGRRKSRDIPPNATFRLTQEGRDKVQTFTGDPSSKILVALETQGTCDIDEISRASGMSRGQVEGLIPRLVRGRSIEYISANMMADTE